jgi:glycosyltransferase involved in cell wall biosynthesis
MRPLELLFIAPYGGLGGSENVLVNVLERLDRERLHPRVLILEEGPLANRVEGLGIPVDVQHLPGKQGVLKFPKAARHPKHPVDVIHANGGKAAVYGLPVARRLNAPLVWMKHDHSYDGRLSHLLASRCAHVVCVSHAMARQFGDIKERVSVVYPGVTLRDLKPVERTAPTIASVGRLDPFKGFDELLKAAAQLRAEGLPVEIRVAGPQDRVHTEIEAQLKQLAEDLGIGAQQVGWADDLDEVYENARVVALASKPKGNGAPGEGAPLVLMEAMGAGRPVVGTDQPGIAEVIDDCGSLVKPPDAAHLANALRPYLEDPALAARTGARGRARVEAHMTLDRTVADLSALYERLARKRAIP